MAISEHSTGVIHTFIAGICASLGSLKVWNWKAQAAFGLTVYWSVSHTKRIISK